MDNEPKPTQPNNDTSTEPVGSGPFTRPAEPAKPVVDDTSTPVAAPNQFGPPKKKSRSKWVVAFLVVLMLAALGGVAYWQYTDANSTRSELAKVENELSLAKAQINKLDGAPADDEDTAEPTSSELTSEEKAKQAASAYYCGVTDFGCDKVTTRVLASVAHSNTSAGFYVIKAETATKAHIIYLKSVDNDKWAVIYVGGGPMDETTTLKFDVPDSISKVNVN